MMIYQDIQRNFYNMTGIEFSDREDVFRRKVDAFCLLHAISSAKELLDSLAKDKKISQSFIDYLTTSETYFYREFAQIKLFISQIKHKSEKLKILSAPCASGEEPFSLLIALLEEGFPLENIELQAMDINATQIAKAIEGVYEARRLHQLPEIFKDKYFLKLSNGQYQINTQFRTRVNFRVVNIFEKLPSEYKDFDVIFSRNMLIYFDKEAQKKVESIFYKLLKDGGSLYLGHADILHNETKFKKYSQEGIKYFLR